MTTQYKTKNKARSAGQFRSLSTPPAGRVSFDPAKKFRKVCTWLRKHTSNLDYGYKWHGSPIHCNTNAETVAFLFRQRNWLGRITNEKFSQHFSGQDTFYFAGCRSGYTLVMLDIDCHKRGSIQGAKDLGESLCRFFPNLYTEISTNGNGVHGYILVEATGKTNSELKRLEKTLDMWLTFHPHDVEMIEVKGLAPTVTVINRRLDNYKAGTLAKVPREAVERFEELTATTTLTLAQLGQVINQVEADCSKPSTEPIVPVTKMQIISKSAVKSAKKKAVGSISGKHINVDRLENYEWFADQLLGNHEIKTTGKHKVTVMDVAICLIILRFCSKNMNVDGSLPTKRIKSLWDALYSCEDVPRPWNCRRYSAIRNWLSSLGVLEWTDETYRLGFGNDDKGQAAKWRINDALLAELDGIEEEKEKKETSFIVTLSPSPTFIRPREVWIETLQRQETLKLIEMSNQVLLLYEQAA